MGKKVVGIYLLVLQKYFFNTSSMNLELSCFCGCIAFFSERVSLAVLKNYHETAGLMCETYITVIS